MGFLIREGAEAKKEDVAAQSMQMPDNLKLNLQFVDVVYEMVDERSNIEISTSQQKQVDASPASVAQTPMETTVISEEPTPQAVGAFPGSMQQPTSSVDWYEIVKIVLLAALFIVVIPKPRRKAAFQSEIVIPDGMRLKTPREDYEPEFKSKKKRKKKDDMRQREN